jgi:hypothetical protein
MREVLSDIVKHCDNFEIIKIVGTENETKIQATSEDRNMYLVATLTEAIPELSGEFGMSNMDLLGRLLNFTSYRADGASLTVKRKTVAGKETVEQLEFKDANGIGKSVYRCMSPERVPDQPEIRPFDWDIKVETTKTSVAEFEALASIYSKIDKMFSAKVENGNLILSIGEDNAATHRGSMVFKSGVEGSVIGDPVWNLPQFLGCLKMIGDKEAVVSISKRGVLGVEIATTFGSYRYLLRAATRGS